MEVLKSASYHPSENGRRERVGETVDEYPIGRHDS